MPAALRIVDRRESLYAGALLDRVLPQLSKRKGLTMCTMQLLGLR
jgi:hypothetical protein